MSLMKFRRIVLYSSPGSREAGEISLLAVAETMASVALFWGLAIVFDVYLHLWVSVLAAPLLMLGSTASTDLGAHLFTRYWEPETSQRNAASIVPMVLLAAAGSGLLTWGLVGDWLATSKGLISFWRALLVGAVACNIAMAATVAAWGLWALKDGKAAAMMVAGAAAVAALAVLGLADLGLGALAGLGEATAMILAALTIAGLAIDKAEVMGVLRGIGVAVVLVTFGFAIASSFVAGDAGDKILSGLWFAGWAFSAVAAVAGLVGTLGLTLVAIGAGVGIFVRACAIRLIATMTQAGAGVRAFPANWLALILQTDMRQRPEVIPGLPDDHMLRSENRYEFWEGVSHLEEVKNMLVVGMFLEVPTLLYRISLKSAAWLYLPLIFLAVPPAKPRGD